MAGSKSSGGAVVTKQPCQRHQHLELAGLTEMVNSKSAMGLGGRPRPPLDCGSGGGGNYRHQHDEAQAVNDLVVGWGLQWWTLGTLISDCLVGQISKAPGEIQDSKNLALRSSGSGSSSNGGRSALKSPAAMKRSLSNYTLIAALQALLGSEQGITTSRRVTFNTVAEVKYVDKCRVLYPPTPVGMEIKRQAFWSRREIQDNQFKWEGHLESYELGRNGFATFCNCHGCVVDGEETNF